jgi:hypothetical protein
VEYLEISSYHRQEIYVGVTHDRETNKKTSLKHRMFMTEREGTNVSELTEMLIIRMR